MCVLGVLGVLDEHQEQPVNAMGRLLARNIFQSFNLFSELITCRSPLYIGVYRHALTSHKTTFRVPFILGQSGLPERVEHFWATQKFLGNPEMVPGMPFSIPCNFLSLSPIEVI